MPFPETKPQTEFRCEKKCLKCLCLVSLSPDPSAQLGFQNASVPSPLVRHRGRIGLGPAFFSIPFLRGRAPRWATKHAGQPNPINPQRDNAGERDSRSSVCTHPPHWVPGRGESGGGKGESQPRRPAQEQQVVARRRRTAHPTVMPCHDYVHVERIKRSCCKLHRAPGTTQLHGNQPANTNLWVSTVLPRAG